MFIMESEESTREKNTHKSKPDLSWILPGVCLLGLMYLLFLWGSKKLERVDKSWGDRIERGYFLNEAYLKWGTDSLNYYDENGSVVFRLWKEQLYGATDSEEAQYYWIALKFDGDTRGSRATSYEISKSRKDLEKLLKEKYSVRDIQTLLLEYSAKAEEGDAIAQNNIALMSGPRVANAQFNLGVIYFNAENKKGELGDFKEAVKWWRKAADQGHETALRLLKDTLKKHPELVDD